MLKREARRIVDERMRSKYDRQEYVTLKKIIDLVRVQDYQTTHIEGHHCIATLKKLAYMVETSEGRVEKIVTKLVADGLLIVHAGEGAKRGTKRDGTPHDAYSIDTEALSRLVELPLWEQLVKEERHARYVRRAARLTIKRSLYDDVIPVTPIVLADTFHRLMQNLNTRKAATVGDTEEAVAA